MNGSAPSTIIAPAGAEVCTHGGAEEVEDATMDEELDGELEDDEELEVLEDADDDVEVVEGAALLEVLVEVVEGAILLDDGLEVLVEVVV